ncbi:hypothetical protein HYW74_04235 [Candidatus Pacearchaeota archaeon]|nr:hypothetical protein [Candidatus Pacearchaeota archaeon]
MNRTIKDQLDRYIFAYEHAKTTDERKEIDKEVIHYLGETYRNLPFKDEVTYLEYYARKRKNGRK